MPVYHYRASDMSGNLVQGSLEAREEGLVVAYLQQSGLIPVRISQEDIEPQKLSLQFWRRRIPLQQVILFTRELAILLKAGLPLERSLQALQEVTTHPRFKGLIGQIARDLQGGKALSEALHRHSLFSPLYISMVEAGETGGFLDEALMQTSAYLQSVNELRAFVMTALIYPVLLLGLGSLSLILMLFYVVPRFEVFFQELGHSLYWSTRILLALSQACRSYWWVGALVAIGVTLSLIKLSRHPQGGRTLDRIKLQAPLLGKMTTQVAAALFGRTLGTLLKNGVPLVSALKVVYKSVTNRHLAHSLASLQTEVEKGQRLSTLLRKNGLFPEIFLQMLAVGEETGRLADMLLSASHSLEDSVRASVRRFLSLLEPVLILSTAIMVGFIIVSLLLPILNLYELPM